MTDINNNSDDNINNNPPKSKRSHLKFDTSKRGKRLPLATKIAIRAQLESGNYSPCKIAKINKVHHQTIYNVMKDKSLPILSSKEIERTRKGLTNLMLNNALQAQKSVNQRKLDSSSFVQLMVGSKIGIEASNLLSGLSTSNVSIRSTIENIDRQREEIVQRLKELE